VKGVKEERETKIMVGNRYIKDSRWVERGKEEKGWME
jgi:hypothetical protein